MLHYVHLDSDICRNKNIRAAASSMNTTTNNALLEDVKKRGRPKGSKDTRPRIT